MKIPSRDIGCEALTAMAMKIAIFWDLSGRSLLTRRFLAWLNLRS
jgi:hypothetical protein